ncbi:hypothetical protein LN528_04385, partial [Xanthomonas vesicatoria]|nr:hypothetical protein [Xanthomonas vesicatoria]MCC8629988.1 hypothetical protein [Xanthomonas vesicatoria]
VSGKRTRSVIWGVLLQETAMHLRRPDHAAGAGCLMKLSAIATSSVDALARVSRRVLRMETARTQVRMWRLSLDSLD